MLVRTARTARRRPVAVLLVQLARVDGRVGQYTEPMFVDGECKVGGCETRAWARGWCNSHYARWRRYGSPTGEPTPLPVGQALDAEEHAVHLTEAETGWVAGLLEGEGCFYLAMRANRDGTPRPSLAISCCMCDEDVVRRLHAIIGVGAVTTEIPKNPKWSQSWTWYISRVDLVVPLLRHLRPHMGARRGVKIDAMLAAAEGWQRIHVRQHGTIGMYRRGCRCAVCRAANTKRHRRYLNERRENGDPVRASA